MAINSAVCGDGKSTKSTGSSDNSKPLYGNVGLKGSNCAGYCSANKCRKKKNSDSKSPYLNGDNVPNMIPSLIEKNFTSKKGSNIVSSFPLAVNIYKANSDEFRHLKSANRKPKKSVLTLPNLPAPLPQTCTVSDMNDSEYFNQDDERKKIKKRNSTTRNRKTKYEFYDMNARYRSQMNTDLDCSSSDYLQQSCKDGKRSRKQKITREPKHGDDKGVPHDVWAILRNINRFQFRPSPPMSDDSFRIPKKRKGRKKRQKDVRVVETEEFAYITSSYDIESKSQRSNSKSSSFDRITVIDKEHEFSQICKAFERRFSRSNNLPKGPNKHQIRNQNNKAITYNNKNPPKHHMKNVIQRFNANQTINNKPLGYEYNQKKLWNNNCGDINENKMQYNVSPNNNFCNDGFFDYNVDTFSNGFGEELEQDFIYSGNSGSSKAAVAFKGDKRDPESSICSSSDRYKPLEGKIKVDFNKVQNRNRQIPPKSVQKLSQSDIKRRIARMKFPIVVLGKDQLSSNFEVVSAEPLQFNGLKTHIWPFMRHWQKLNTQQNIIKEDITFKAKTDSSLQKKRSNTKTDSVLQKKKFNQSFLDSNKLASNKLELNKYQRTNKGMITQKSVNSDKASNNDSKIKHSSAEHKPVKTPKRAKSPQKRPTSVYMFKQKMMELLYNNLPVQSLANESKAISKHNDVKTKLTSKITYNGDNTPVKRGWVKSKEVPRNPINSPVKTNKQGVTSKKPFSKPSWASEFIDNVIKKIKNGVYYTHDSSKLINRKREIKLKEVEIQTIATGIDKSNSIMQSISKVTITKKSLGRINLPGFDDSKLPALEIQTLNSNEILVKHCVTNILVHFDITAPIEPILNVKKSMALMPLDGGGSLTKTYKCKASIINSMLPAEICTLLPKMMSNLSVESSSGLLHPRNSLDKSPTLLSTISEMHTEIPDTLRPLPCLLHLKMAVEQQGLLDGFYPRKTIKRKFITPKLSFSKPLEIEMLPILSRKHLFNCALKSTAPMVDPFRKIMLEERAKNPFCQNPVNTCVTIQTYSTSNRLTAFRRFDLNSFLKKSIHSYPQIPVILPHVFNYLFDKNITINLTTINSHGLEELITLNVRSLMTGINNRNSTKATENLGIIKKDLSAIEYNELKAPVSNKNSLIDSIDRSSNGSNKTKKKSYQKLYRKCQSTSNISVKASTSLSKITNIDEFFQAIGLATQFSAVFDKNYCTKIMSSLKEMSNWIMDINPTQALLVLLLTNKKDTPDLLRFRPVILQGIAFKRITRAKELDMELEVIEREQMNVGCQYEGISYLPASPENQDNLLEELCWIAKTTASDYQTIFDESSRRLLKSLLEKRKKLNPSYLRVMARYVGLGLLKTPQKTMI